MADRGAAPGLEPLLELLSEFLAVVRAGQRLYTEGVDDAPADLRDRLREYGDESRRHVDLLVEAIRDLGGDPTQVSVRGRLVQELGELTLRAAGDAERGPYYRLEGLLLYEVRDAVIGQVLDGIAEATEDEKVRDVLRRVVVTVLTGEALGAHDVPRSSERVAWLEETMRAVALRQFGITPPTRWQRLLRGY